MPKEQRPTKTALAQLGRLPQQPSLVLEGGKRLAGVYYRRNKETLQPQVALWVDQQTGFVRGTTMIDPVENADDNGVGAALVSLIEALIHPVVAPVEEPESQPHISRSRGAIPPLPRLQAPNPALPGTIRINDVELAEAARAIFSPLNVNVEYAEELPAFDLVFRDMVDALGGDPDAPPPEPFSWNIDPALVAPLFTAATKYARRAPWNYMPDHPPLAVNLGSKGPQPKVKTLYASIMGGGGQVTGIAFYNTLDDFYTARQRGAEMDTSVPVDDETVRQTIEMMRQAGAPLDGVPPDEVYAMVADLITPEPEMPEITYENCLVFFLESRDESDATYIEWLQERNIKVPRQHIPFFLRTAPETKPRQPNEREVRALTLAIDAVEVFFKKHQRLLQSGFLPVMGLTSTYTPLEESTPDIVVQFPPLGYDWSQDVMVIDSLEDDDEDDWDDGDGDGE